MGVVMKSVLAAVSVAALAVTSASAADLAARPYTKAPAYVNPLYDWSGFYVGAHVGYAWGEEHDNLSAVFLGAQADRFNVDGVIGGVHTGYNWQAGHYVFGLEGDFDGSDVKGSQAFAVTANNAHHTGTLSFKTDWQASIRARLGYAVDNWLLYATGGVAFADAKSTFDIGSRGVSCEGTCLLYSAQGLGSATFTGWTVGVGSEYALSRNWIARAEVRYSDFGSKTFLFKDGFGGARPTQVRFDQVHATVGISYKF
jgi:outer membrane immunogenic protein